jgi:hypothetical protein
MKTPYDDIIDLPRHVSSARPPMSRENRAAQFSPFAALTGHDAAVRETARLTEQKIELGDGAVAELDMKLNMLADMMDYRPEVAVTHFVPDEKKDGGAYVATTGAVKKIDDYERAIVLESGEKIGISDILEIDSDIFNELL